MPGRWTQWLNGRMTLPTELRFGSVCKDPSECREEQMTRVALTRPAEPRRFSKKLCRGLHIAGQDVEQAALSRGLGRATLRRCYDALSQRRSPRRPGAEPTHKAIHRRRAEPRSLETLGGVAPPELLRGKCRTVEKAASRVRLPDNLCSLFVGTERVGPLSAVGKR